MCPQPDCWCVALRGKEVGRPLQNITAFLRKQHSEDVSCPPPPHKCQLAWSLGRVSGRGKNKAEGFLFYFVTPLPKVKCVCADAGDEQKLGSEELKWAFARGPLPFRPGLWEHICQFSGQAPWPAHLPLPPLNTSSQLCCHAATLRGPRAASPRAWLSKRVPSE